MRAYLVIASMLALGCGGAPANEGEPVSESPPSSTPSSTPTSTTPRHARATRGAAIVEITDTPGFLIDGNAPPPPPGTPPARHVALTANCRGDIAGCSESGTIVRAATSFDAAVEGLRGIGFEVVITP